MDFPADQAAVLIDKGERAAELLANPTFTSTVNELSTLYLAQLVASPPGARGLEARERYHLLHHALTEITAQLVATADTGARVKASLEYSDDEDM